MRELRDLLAEGMRRERLGLMRPLWDRLCEIDDESAEQWRFRADHLIRLLSEMGVTLACAGADASSAPPPSSPVIWRYRLSGAATERLVRKGPADQWQIVLVEGGERVEHTFSLTDAHIHAGMVLMGDPAAKAIANLGKELSAALEIYRTDAAAMESSDQKKEATP